MTRRPPARRAAFTLIELLVVIAIIAILVSLIGPAIQKARGGGTRTRTVAEIQQLSTAVDDFKREFKFVPPTSFRIPATKQTLPASSGHVDYPGCVLLTRMFPRCLSGIAEGAATGFPGGGTTVTGSASLVYFLGGPNALFPVAGRRTGWATDAPVAPTQNAAALKGPFFDFQPNRVVAGQGYFDFYGTPYAYFGSTDSGNYNPAETLSINGTSITPLRTGTAANFKWLSERTCQIVSAGENQLFGAGGFWAPNTGSYISGQNGGDDLPNFNGGKILAAQGN